jgi:hypothetical protein
MNPGVSAKEAIRERINNLNFLIILLDKGFPPCYKLKSFNTKEVGDLNIMSFLMKTFLKQKKEDGMKKLVIVAIALLLAMPVLSHAGSATSKWDMTISGHALMLMSWNSQDADARNGFRNAVRDNGTLEVRDNWRDNMNMDSQGRLNFTVKGPDVFGAKTGGRVELDVLGAVNAFNLRHAYMTLDWANDTILIGNTWYGILQSVPNAGLSLESLPNPTVPTRTQQIRWDHRFGKMVRTSFGIENPSEGGWGTGPTGATGAPANANGNRTNWSRSMYPGVYGLVEFKSDVCGKVGPNSLTFGIAGQYNRIKFERGNFGAGTAQVAAARGTYSNTQENGWSAVTYFYVPIIPARANNNAGALGITGGVMAAQGSPMYGAAPYIRGAVAAVSDISKPKQYGLYGAFDVYVYNNVHVAGLYTDSVTVGSSRWDNANPDTVRGTKLYNLALIYDPSPAMKFGVEYGRIHTQFAGASVGLGNANAGKRTGDLDMLRFFAGYYF